MMNQARLLIVLFAIDVIALGCHATTPSAATRSSNAADSYREAATLTNPLYTDAWGRYEEGNFDKDAAEFFAKNGRVADLLRAGAACPTCDWGGPLPDGHVSLNALRTAASFTVSRARFEKLNGNTDAAVEDLLAVAMLGRRVGADGLMIDKLIEEGMESTMTSCLASILPALSNELLSSLRTRLAALPKSSTGPEIMAAEFRYERENVLRRQANAAAIAMVDTHGPLYQAMADAWGKLQPEFAAGVDAKMEELKLDDSAKQIAIVTVKIHEILAVNQAKRTMLFTAIDILTHSEAAIQDSHDPFGNGPFGYVKTAEGFELTSDYKPSNQPSPIKLTVGE